MPEITTLAGSGLRLDAVGIATLGPGGLVCAGVVISLSVVGSIGSSMFLDSAIGPPTVRDDD